MREIAPPKMERRQVTAWCPRCKHPTTAMGTERVRVQTDDGRAYGAHADCYPELRRR